MIIIRADELKLPVCPRIVPISMFWAKNDLFHHLAENYKILSLKLKLSYCGITDMKIFFSHEQFLQMKIYFENPERFS